MNKEEVLNLIKSLPKFELRDVGVKEGQGYVEAIGRKAIIIANNPSDVIDFVSNSYRLLQFEDIFAPAVSKIEEVEDCFVYSYRGKGHLEIYPRGDIYEIEGGRIGLVIRNSVDRAWAVRIDFAINIDGLRFILPRKIIKGLRKVHRGGNVEVAVGTYLNLITNVKEVWKTIVSDFQKYTIKNVEEFAEDTGLGKKILKKLSIVLERKGELNLWEAFLISIKEITSRKYKSEISRMAKIEKITNAIFKYALTLSI